MRRLNFDRLISRGRVFGLACVAIAGCAGQDGGDTTSGGSTSDATTGEPTGDPTGGPNPMPCSDFDEDLSFDAMHRSPTPQGLLASVNVFEAGATLTYSGGGDTALDLVFAYAGGKIHASGSDCPETGIQGTMTMEVVMSFATADGVFNEMVPASVGVDLQSGSAWVWANNIDPADVQGSFEAPAMIGPYTSGEFLYVELVFLFLLADVPPSGDVSLGGALASCNEPECQYFASVATWVKN